jgi:hypothetical protein
LVPLSLVWLKDYNFFNKSNIDFCKKNVEDTKGVIRGGKMKKNTLIQWPKEKGQTII